MIIQHNIPAMNSYRNLNNNQNAIAGNLEKLSSGYKINRAGDDAAGLAISEKMRAQITGLDGAQKNVADGISLVKTAEGALQEVHDMLNRMVYLAEVSANGTMDDTTDRAALQAEVVQLKEEIDRISESTNFNGINLLDGSLDASLNGSATLSGVASDVESFFVSGTVSYIDAKGNIVSGADSVAKGGSLLSGTYSATAGNTITFSDGDKVSILGVEYTIKILDKDDEKYGEYGITSTSGKLVGNIIYASSTGNISSTAVTNADFGNTKLEVDGTLGSFTVSSKDQVNGYGGGLELQIGDTSWSYNQLTVSVACMNSSALNIDGIDISKQGDAQDAIDAAKGAINIVSTNRARLGATQNRLEHTMNNLSVMEENIQDAESTIRDTDVADEMMEYTKNNILIQSSQSMLAQANQLPQGVLQLLG